MLANSNGSSGGNNVVGDRTNSNSVGGQNGGTSLSTNMQYGANGANSITNLGANLIANDLAREYLKGGSRQTLSEIAAAGESLEKVAKVTSILGKVFGVASAVQHADNLITDYNRDGLWSAGVAINTGKLVLDGVFFFAKSTNPVFLGAAILYSAADYMTNDK